MEKVYWSPVMCAICEVEQILIKLLFMPIELKIYNIPNFNYRYVPRAIFAKKGFSFLQCYGFSE